MIIIRSPEALAYDNTNALIVQQASSNIRCEKSHFRKLPYEKLFYIAESAINLGPF